MNREHVVGCPALRAGVRCTCQIVPSSRVKPPTRVEEIRRKFPNMVGTWGAEAITFLLAENERLREQMEREVAWRDHALMLANRAADRVPALYARTRALEAALDKYAKGYTDGGIMAREALAEAALPEPTPPAGGQG